LHTNTRFQQLPSRAKTLGNSASFSFTAGLERTRVNTSGPSSVIATVCSEWALGWPSTVTTVHPSFKVLV
jgi:hypothetical protein